MSVRFSVLHLVTSILAVGEKRQFHAVCITGAFKFKP